MNHKTQFSIRSRLLKTESFTLIELLVVISIIIVLVGLLLPAIHETRKKQKVSASKGTIHSIQMALERYYNEYSRWPIKSDGSIPNGKLVASELEALQLILTGTDCYLDDSTPSAGTPKGNPRKMRFLEISDKYLKTVDATLVDEVYVRGAGPIVLVDPWDCSYMVSLDHDGDRRVSSLYTTPATIEGEVSIWSAGPDKKIVPADSGDDYNKDNFSN